MPKYFITNNNIHHKKRIFKLLLLGIICLLPAQYCSAKKVPGYVVSHSSDTINGEIEIPRYDILTRGYSINGINLESLYISVRFKNPNKKKRKRITYSPTDIKAFGFKYKESRYLFKSFTIENKSIIKSEREQQRFLSLILYAELSKIAIYKDVIRQAQYENSTNSTLRYQTTVKHDYYLFNEKIGLKRVEKNKAYRTLTEMLRYFEIEDEFLQQLSPTITFKQVKEVLVEYEKWKRGKIRNT